MLALGGLEVRHLPSLGGELCKVLRYQGLLCKKAHFESVLAVGELLESQEEFDVGGPVCSG